MDGVTKTKATILVQRELAANAVDKPSVRLICGSFPDFLLLRPNAPVVVRVNSIDGSALPSPNKMFQTFRIGPGNPKAKLRSSYRQNVWRCCTNRNFPPRSSSHQTDIQPLDTRAASSTGPNVAPVVIGALSYYHQAFLRS